MCALVTGVQTCALPISKGDMSISWVAQIVNGTTWVSSLTSDAPQEALFGEGPKSVCGAYNPTGKARRVDGGWIANGARPYTPASRPAARPASAVEQHRATVHVESGGTWFITKKKN